MSRRSGLVLGASLAIVVAVLMAVDPTATRFVLAILAALLLPGLGWARQVRLRSPGDTIALAVVLNVSMLVVVGMVVASGTWSVGGGSAVLALVAAAGFLPSRTLAVRAWAAVRLPGAGVADDGGAWAQWYSATQEHLARRTEQNRAWKNAAAQRAVQEWVAWYQRTHLLTLRHDG